MRDYFVYILSNNAQVLYIGVTSDLDDRLFEHTRNAIHPVLPHATISTGWFFVKPIPQHRRQSPGEATQGMDS